MGGFGSGASDRKTTVEESLIISVGHFYRQRRSMLQGTLVWNFGGGNTSSLSFENSFQGMPVITLRYRRHSTDVELPIRLQSTPSAFNGERWWFTCPINGRHCNQRVSKLYLPPGQAYFGCRKCHDLTYRSSQEAHRAERGTGSLEWYRRHLDALKRGNQKKRR